MWNLHTLLFNEFHPSEIPFSLMFHKRCNFDSLMGYFNLLDVLPIITGSFSSNVTTFSVSLSSIASEYINWILINIITM